MRGELVEAEHVFMDTHARDLENQQQLQGLRALASQQNITAEQYAQYEGAGSLSMGELRNELRAAIATPQQQQRQLEA